MLLRNLSNHDAVSSQAELNDGLPTILALARLCGRAISGEILAVQHLSESAKAILALGSKRGVYEIRGNTDGFESADRFLAVCVEVESDQRLIFRDKSNPRNTMKFLEGFRQLCQSGLVLHQTQKEFSLTDNGFDLAESLDVRDFESLTQFAVEVEH